MLPQIESMYDGNLAQDVAVSCKVERKLRFQFKTKDELFGFTTKLVKEPIPTREGAVTYELSEIDTEGFVAVVLMTTERSFGDGISPDLVHVTGGGQGIDWSKPLETTSGEEAEILNRRVVKLGVTTSTYNPDGTPVGIGPRLRNKQTVAAREPVLKTNQDLKRENDAFCDVVLPQYSDKQAGRAKG